MFIKSDPLLVKKISLFFLQKLVILIAEDLSYKNQNKNLDYLI